jgi:hypothetical protein
MAGTRVVPFLGNTVNAAVASTIADKVLLACNIFEQKINKNLREYR